MASHRKSRPLGQRVTGPGTSAAAEAASAYADLVSRAAEAASEGTAPEDEGGPSLAEVGKKIDAFYLQSEPAAVRSEATRERTGKQRTLVSALLDDVAKRTQMLNTARERFGALTGTQYRTDTSAQDTAALLLANTPEDYFGQEQLMSRLTERQKQAVDTGGTAQQPAAAEDPRRRAAAGAVRQPAAAREPGRARRGVEPPAESRDGDALVTAKSTVQKKLAHARALLSKLDAVGAGRVPPRSPDPADRAGPVGAPYPAAGTAASPYTTEAVGAPYAAAQAVGSPYAYATQTPGAPYGTETAGTPYGTETAGAPYPAAPGASPYPAHPGGAWDAAKAEQAVAFARAQLGKPSLWGAAGPGSYDCSGLTQAAWKAAGVALPRAVHDQARAGVAVPLADARPGDLIFFDGGIGHVGIHIGDGMMIHAPNPGAYVREDSVHHLGETIIHSVVRVA
ncbi:C40 family peptidase [Streptomyces mangrovisoli]|uniref:NlpC/P60 domain-containing protein n=1 Tax=Streptomyces mangrovisoli TaxID=1428628 RepID=A0A1J4P1R3_9ACTN|nr:C40 family peptidase [Streptomyces mangrovisoli]OIJ67421.1 hypothetical protein WN71_012575 [Streptomyces mangrovisoli]